VAVSSKILPTQYPVVVRSNLMGDGIRGVRLAPQLLWAPPVSFDKHYTDLHLGYVLCLGGGCLDIGLGFA
jgi:hypothetical protein